MDWFEFPTFARGLLTDFSRELFTLIQAKFKITSTITSDALNVLASMMETHSNEMSCIILSNHSMTKQIQQLLTQLPRAMAFQVQALSLEVAFRLVSRASKDSNFKKSYNLILSAAPGATKLLLKQTKPSAFHDAARRVLNEMNRLGKRVHSFPVTCIELETRSKVVYDSEWCDIGVGVLECTLRDQGEIKLPLDLVKTVNCSNNQVVIDLEKGSNSFDVFRTCTSDEEAFYGGSICIETRVSI